MIRLRALAPVLALAALAAGCGGSSSSPTANGGSTPPSTASVSPTATAPADEAAAKAEIKANWTKFYAYKTTPAQAAALLEDGDQMAGALAFARQEQAQTHIKQNVKVSVITFTDATHANVTYALLNGSTPLLPNASGVAVLVDGSWKVSKTSFCTLVQLGANGKTVPGC
ncbi:MAG TPA: hypothetical protein VFJ17_09505 [Mycobacteriales bacterium]|jgi:hypothetical protein|nr:hypothetical protein [Mycobacteriales bacterium]